MGAEISNTSVDLQSQMGDDNVVDLEDSTFDQEKDKRKRKKRKQTSTVWNYFELLPHVGEDKKKAKCKDCGGKYIAEGAYETGNMKRHILKCPRRDMRDISQMMISKKKDKWQCFQVNCGAGIVIACFWQQYPFVFAEAWDFSPYAIVL